MTSSLPNFWSHLQTPEKEEMKEKLFLTQEKSFDLGSTDPCGSPTAVNLWLETDVFQLRKHYAVLRSSSVCKLIKLNFLLFSVFYLSVL
jgi:hypothetical protein